jgi:hypothetical protein
MYPSDAISIYDEISGNVTHTLVSGTSPKTILGVSFQQENISSDTSLRCGNNIVAKNYATNLNYNPLSYICNDTINILKTGNDDASIIVTYVPRDVSIPLLNGENGTTSVSTSTKIYMMPYFTAGEMIISLFLFVLCVMLIMQYIAKGLSIFNTKKRYMQYGGGDVEVRDDL